MLDAGRLGVLLDFDGTVSEIAPTPAEATISPRARSALTRLVGAVSLVSLVSGRSVRDLAEKSGLDGVVHVGNHGVEYLAGGSLQVAPEAEPYATSIGLAMDRLEAIADGPGLVWQRKEFGGSVHYRLSDDPEATEARLAAAVQSVPEAAELDVFWGKMVMELRAPVGLHKGYAVRKLVGDYRLDSAIFVGDDRTDVDGLAAIRDMKDRSGFRGLGVMVRHPDSPDDLFRNADYALPGVAGVEEFLEWIVSETAG